jgi:hypothetical protein
MATSTLRVGPTPTRTPRSRSPRPAALQQGIVDREEEVLSDSGLQRDRVRRFEERVAVAGVANGFDVDWFVRLVGPNPRGAEVDPELVRSDRVSVRVSLHQVVPTHQHAPPLSVDSPTVELVQGDAMTRNG